MPTVPSFDGLQPASPASSWAKRRTPRRDTKHEIMLRRELWRMGLRYRKHVDSLPGKPDIVFGKSRVVVFCDGDFWHGRDWPTLRQQLQGRANAAYWIAKIASNIQRDKRHTAELQAAGWRVLRLWESDIKHDPHAAALAVGMSLRSRSHRAAGKHGPNGSTWYHEVH